jgi:putative oxidoreductase
MNTEMNTLTSSPAPETIDARLGRFKEWRDSLPLQDISLLAARLGLAWIFIYHGAGTLFGAFGGVGLHRTAVFFATTAHLHPGMLFAVLNGAIEFFGGIAIGLGILSRLAGLALVGDMVIAMATVTFSQGFESSAAGPGYELNVALAVLALVVALQGPGRISVDALFTRGGHQPATLR